MKANANSLLGAALLSALVYLASQGGARTQPQSPLASMPPRVGYVDLDAIAGKAKFAKDLKTQVEAEFETKRKRFQDDQDGYAALLEEIKREEAGLSDEAKDAKYKKALQLKSKLDEEQYAIDKFLKESEKKKAPALERIMSAAKDVANDEGFDILVSKELLIYGRESVDLSDRVVARLDSQPEPAAAKGAAAKDAPKAAEKAK